MNLKHSPNTDYIELYGARIHNLKNIDLKIPKNQIIAITGVSGSGKSSLAFDILFEEGRRRYFQAIGLPPRLENEKQFDLLTGLAPTIAVAQRTGRNSNPRSTVGTRTGIYNYLRMLYATESSPLCPICKEPVNDKMECDLCGMPADRLEVKNFSFNEPSGMCLECNGRGYIRAFKEEKMIPDPTRNLIEICAVATGAFSDLKGWLPSIANYYKFDIGTSYKQLPKEIQDIFLHGSGKKIEVKWESKNYTHETKRIYEGVIPHLERAMERSSSEYRRKLIEKNYMEIEACPECHGYRINQTARESLFHGKHIGELAMMTVEDLLGFFTPIVKSADRSLFISSTGEALVNRIFAELKKFDLIGLTYLQLNRRMNTLSGGENQRLSLMSQMNLGLSGCILILDEPTMGMHELEKRSLANIIKELRDTGNSVIVVEHDENLITIADEIIDLGPLSGTKGGDVVFQGNLNGIKKSKPSLTGQFLSGSMAFPEPQLISPGEKSGDKKQWLTLTEISTNNLQNISLKIPLHCMVGVCGMSGSGKSSLISDTVVPKIKEKIKIARRNASIKITKSSKKPKSLWQEILEDTSDPLEVVSGTVSDWEAIEKCVIVDQSPIGRNRNSFPASYIGLWDFIRKLFTKQPEAKKRKYKEGHFSFNSDKGRCPNCKGEGRIALNISFLDSITMACESCNGERYLPEILEIAYNGFTIREVLDLSVEEALDVFANEPKIKLYLEILNEIGMGYITLGQPATTLSGGEAQRIKLAKALGKNEKKHTLYVLDEPSTGLHFYDEVKLITLLRKIVSQGHSIFIIEHNPNLLRQCDWLVELGPKGGPQGGRVIAQGSQSQILMEKNSIIKEFL